MEKNSEYQLVKRVSYQQKDTTERLRVKKSETKSDKWKHGQILIWSSSKFLELSPINVFVNDLID